MSEKFWSPIVRALQPYVPGEQPKVRNLIKLNTNENPYGPSPKVLEAIAAQNCSDLRLYPDPEAEALKNAAARFYGVEPSNIFAGNGSDEVLAHVFYALLKQDKPLLYPDITYSFYPVYCGLYGIEYCQIPLAEDFSICLENYYRPNGGIIFANPNAPTGMALPVADIESLLQKNTESVVVVDEAYVDFGAESCIGLIQKYPNLLVIQTLSKSRSLAGLRVGLAIGDRGLIEALERVKNSFNSYPLDRLAMNGAVAAYEDRDYFDRTCRKVIASRERLSAQLQQRGFEVLPSRANFLFARTPARDAGALAAQLREKNILVRHFTKPQRIAQFLRISIGTDVQCDALLAALDGSGFAPCP